MQNLSLVLGGAASGKSAFAEGLCLRHGGPRSYVATAEARDEEMRAKVARHRARRGAGWAEHEAPLDLRPALAAVPPGGVALVDCATLWLSNVMLAGLDPAAEGDRLVAALAACRGDVVVVSNELGLGLVPDTALGRAFREAQGALNQRLAAEAALVALVVAGLPLVLKGRLP